jgi:protein-S-isoprenylcysteine O-methyltransferase Ste14
MNSGRLILGLWLAALLMRHVLQLAIDLRNTWRTAVFSVPCRIRAAHVVALWAAFHVASVASFIHRGGHDMALVVGGLIALAAGTIVGICGILTLGRAYHIQLAIPAGAGLIQHGIYRFVRHPIRLGLALETLGAMLMAQQPLLSPLWVCFLWTQFVRGRSEDAMLRQHFGAAAINYQARVPSFLPIGG